MADFCRKIFLLLGTSVAVIVVKVLSHFGAFVPFSPIKIWSFFWTIYDRNARICTFITFRLFFRAFIASAIVKILFKLRTLMTSSIFVFESELFRTLAATKVMVPLLRW